MQILSAIRIQNQILTMAIFFSQKTLFFNRHKIIHGFYIGPSADQYQSIKRDFDSKQFQTSSDEDPRTSGLETQYQNLL